MHSVLFFPSCLTRSAVSLSMFVYLFFGIFGFPLDCGYRAQLSAEAGQRRPSQKEKYVRRRNYLSPLCHHTPGPPPLHPAQLLDWMKMFAWLHFPPVVAPFRVPPPVELIIQSKGFSVHECVT